MSIKNNGLIKSLIRFIKFGLNNTKNQKYLFSQLK